MCSSTECTTDLTTNGRCSWLRSHAALSKSPRQVPVFFPPLLCKWARAFPGYPCESGLYGLIFFPYLSLPGRLLGSRCPVLFYLCFVTWKFFSPRVQSMIFECFHDKVTCVLFLCRVYRDVPCFGEMVQYGAQRLRQSHRLDTEQHWKGKLKIYLVKAEKYNNTENN